MGAEGRTPRVLSQLTAKSLHNPKQVTAHLWASVSLSGKAAWEIRLGDL